MSRFLSNNNPMDIELALMALAASSTPEDACTFLETEHKLRTQPHHLAILARTKPKQYEELRTKIVPLKEEALVHNMLDNAGYASDVTKLAMEQLVDRLERNQIKPEYLSRVARDIADVQTKAVDKMLTLQGRPTSISETRSAPEIIRKLQQMGVIQGTAELEP